MLKKIKKGGGLGQYCVIRVGAETSATGVYGNFEEAKKVAIERSSKHLENDAYVVMKAVYKVKAEIIIKEQAII